MKMFYVERRTDSVGLKEYTTVNFNIIHMLRLDLITRYKQNVGIKILNNGTKSINTINVNMLEL